MAGRGPLPRRRRDAVVLAHNYQAPEIQDVADHVGDSLALSRIAAASDASHDRVRGRALHGRDREDPRPDKTVLMPDARAGCSLADTITADQLRAWKAEHPGAVVVAYVNTTAEVKAETDICCTSSNAVEVVESIPADREVLFLPDQFLGAHVQRVTGRAEHARSGWASATCTPASPRADLRHERRGAPGRRAARPPRVRLRDARAVDGVATGSCRPSAPTSSPPAGCWSAARRTTAKRVLVATEIGMLHQLRKANPATDFEPVNPARPART